EGFTAPAGSSCKRRPPAARPRQGLSEHNSNPTRHLQSPKLPASLVGTPLASSQRNRQPGGEVGNREAGVVSPDAPAGRDLGRAPGGSRRRPPRHPPSPTAPPPITPPEAASPPQQAALVFFFLDRATRPPIITFRDTPA